MDRKSFPGLLEQIISQKLMSVRSNSVGRFCIEQAQSATPRHLIHKRKISHLQSKIHFFQGQVDPLHLENKSLKEQLTALTRVTSLSTDIFRSLLSPKYDAPRKLKLQLANLLQIADMVRQDWHAMEQIMAQDKSSIKKLTDQSNDWQCRFINEHHLREEQVQKLEQDKIQIRAQHEAFVMKSYQQLKQTLAKHEQEKQLIKNHYQRKLNLYQNGIQQYQRFKETVSQKYHQYDTSIQRLNEQMAANLVSFEESKKNIKQIYDKLMNDRLTEQAEGYELVIKIREDEKVSLMSLMSEKEEEYKKQIVVKDYEISKLNEAKKAFQEQIGSLKDDLWSKKLTIDQHIAQQKSLQEKIKAGNALTENLLEKIDKKSRQIQHQKKEYEHKIKKQQLEMEAIKKDSNKAMAMMIEEKQKIQGQLQAVADKYKQVCVTMAKMEAQNNQKLMKLKEQFSQNQEELKKNIASTSLKLDQQTRMNKALRFQQEQLIKQHDEYVKQLHSEHDQKEKDMIHRYENKIEHLKLQSTETLESMQKVHETTMRQATIAANEEMRQMTLDNNKKLAVQAEQFLLKIEEVKKEEQALKEILKQKEEKIQHHNKQLEALNLKHKQELQEMQEQKQKQRELLEKEFEQQLLEFQKSLEEKQLELSIIKQNMENEIKLLKEANGIEQLEARFKHQIQLLKKQFEQKIQTMNQQFQAKYQHLEQSKRQMVGQLIESNRQSITSLTTTYNRHLDEIAEKTQQNEAKLNNKLLGSMSSEVEGSSTEEKIQYIGTKISQMKGEVAAKDSEIASLQNTLDELTDHFEQRIKAKKQQMELERQNNIKNCNDKVAKNVAQCKAKVEQVEKSRLQHAQIMQKDFIEMQLAHQRQIDLLMLKYRELQKLFAQRPSRMEDLNKIKELINMQTQKDIEIHGYQRRMQTANEIVKYLNLQLLNYKDSYDIFGPQDSTKGQLGLVGHGMAKSPHPKSYSQTIQIMQMMKNIKQEKEQNENKLEIKTASKEAISYRKLNETPAVKQLKIFQEQNNGYSSSIDLTFKPYHSPKNQPHYSNLIHEKPEKRQRYKTEKNEKTVSEDQIMNHAENFIKILKKGQLSNQVIRQEESNRKRAYRKRKVGKKNTVGPLSYG